MVWGKQLREWIIPLFADKRPEKILFRVDAGCVPGLSFGHLARCLVLAGLFYDLFHSEHVFLMKEYDDGLRHARAAGQNVCVMPSGLDTDQEREFVLQMIGQFCPDWHIVDVPYADTDVSYFPKVQETGCKILFIDDARFLDPGADVLLNSSVLAQKRTIKLHGDRTSYLLGPEFFIFDGSGALTSKKPGAKREVLVTFGGSDPTGLTVKVVKALLTEEWPGTHFTVVLGPGFQQLEKIEKMMQGREDDFKALHNPATLIHLFAESFLTICAGGRTMYELYHLHKDFFPIATAVHESEAVAEFVRQGFVSHGLEEWHRQLFVTTLQEILA